MEEDRLANVHLRMKLAFEEAQVVLEDAQVFVQQIEKIRHVQLLASSG